MSERDDAAAVTESDETKPASARDDAKAVGESDDAAAVSARAAELAATLAHDVGKYIARAARNLLPSGAIPPALTTMLVADVFATHAGRPALTRFDELAPELLALSGDARLAAVRALLIRAAAHERAVRDGDAAVSRELAALALEIESLLRALSRDLRGGGRR